jgi:hypothetical protein
MFRLLLFFSLLVISAVSFAGDDYDTSIRYLHVQKGQTLSNIVRRLYADRRSEWPELTRKIVQLNPHAFINQDPARMKAGVRLELPVQQVNHAAARKAVGHVTVKSGNVVAVDARKVSRRLDVQSPVYIGDKIITGEHGMVQLNMIDQAVLNLSCFSVMMIEQYALSSGNRASIINLLQGTLRKVTGSIGGNNKDVYELKTPVASVGVRGTEYALRVYQPKGCGGKLDADDSLYIEVIKGIVDVHNDAGSEVLVRGDSAVVPLPTVAPKKQAMKPGILAPVEESDQSTNLWLSIAIIALILLL